MASSNSPGRKYSALLAAFYLWVSAATNAPASLAALNSHATLSTDGKRLLVMNSPLASYAREHPVHFSLPNGSTVILHEAFAKSGCYDVATLTPIWQADWYAEQDDLRWSSDFSDVVLINPRGFKSDWALAFYHDGKLKRRYDCQYLLSTLNRRMFFGFPQSDWRRRWYDKLEVERNDLVLSTASGELDLWFFELELGLQETYTFDLSSGVVIGRVTTGEWRMWLYGMSSIVVFILTPLGYYFHCRGRRERTARLQPEA